MRSIQYRASPASIYIYWWVDRSTCLASRISTQKESFPRSEFKPASIWTCWMLIGRQMQSAFMPELHRGFRRWPPATCTTRTSFDHYGKRSGILYKKWVSKNEKSRISHWSESDENAKWLRDCLWLCQACKRGFTWPMERNLRQEAHSYPQADICSAPLQLPAWHTSNKNKIAGR